MKYRVLLAVISLLTIIAACAEDSGRQEGQCLKGPNGEDCIVMGSGGNTGGIGASNNPAGTGGNAGTAGIAVGGTGGDSGVVGNCPVGEETCDCNNGNCKPGLDCASNKCVILPTGTGGSTGAGGNTATGGNSGTGGIVVDGGDGSVLSCDGNERCHCINGTSCNPGLICASTWCVVDPRIDGGTGGSAGIGGTNAGGAGIGGAGTGGNTVNGGSDSGTGGDTGTGGSDAGLGGTTGTDSSVTDGMAGDVCTDVGETIPLGGSCVSSGQCIDSECCADSGIGGMVCRDLENDPKNCGHCGTVCPSGKPYCQIGECRTELCGQGLSACPGVTGSCIDEATDSNHCGNCDTRCISPESCVGKHCVLVTP